MLVHAIRNDSRYFPTRRGVGAFVVIGIALSVACCDWIGLTSVVDGPLYDLSLRLKSTSPTDTTSVLLVYANRETLESHADRTNELLARLTELHARAIGVVVPLADEVIHNLEAHDNVVFAGDATQTNENTPGRGSVELQFDQTGVYRNHYVTRDFSDAGEMSLEAVLARRVLLRSECTIEGQFGIHFRGPPNSLPHIDEETVLRGDLIPELVSGRVVLIGYKQGKNSIGVTTPTTSASQQMSRLELHGHILHTLLGNRAILRLGVIGRLTLIVIVTCVVLLAYRKSSNRLTVTITIGTVLATLVCGWAVMHWFSLWLPLTSLIVIQGWCCLYVVERRLRFLSVATHQLALQDTVRQQSLQQRVLSAHDPWSEIAELTDQLFHSSRMAFLELPAGEIYLKIVKMLHCDENDIFERRRDSRRMPFSGAAEGARPFSLNVRPFLKQATHADESQMLIPLMFGGELLGFIVVALDSAELSAQHDFEDRIHQLSQEIAALLAECRGLHREEQREQSWLRQISTIPEERSVVDLVRAEQLSQRRLAQLENAFESTDSAAAIYDAFGRMVTVNSRMLQLLQSQRVVASETNSIELLVTLTGRDLNECRRLLRQTVIERREQSLIITAGDQRDGESVLHMCPIHAASENQNQSDLQVRGIYFELIQGSAFSEIHHWKDRVSHQICNTVNKQLDQLYLTTKELGREGEESAEIQRLVSLIKDDVYDLKSTISQSQSFLDQGMSDDAKMTLPADSLKILEGVLKRVEHESDHRGIVLDKEFPIEMSDALANPILLQRVFQTIVDVLLVNAYDNSKIRIEAEDEFVQVTYRFQNEGYGTATQHLRRSLEGTVDSADEFQRLKEINKWLEIWDGRMTVTSQMSEGISIELVLRCHHWVLNDPYSAAMQSRILRAIEEKDDE